MSRKARLTASVAAVVLLCAALLGACVAVPEQPAAIGGVNVEVVKALKVQNDASVGGALEVTGATTVGGTLDVTGATNFVGAVTGGAVTNDLNGSAFILDPTGSTILRAQVDDTVTLTSASATGTWGVKTGNLTVGAGAAGVALNGQDVYISDHLEVDGAVTTDGTVTLGDGGDTVAVNSSDWDITTAGVMTGIGAITSDGAVATTSTLGVGTWLKMASQTPVVVSAGSIITPTGTLQPLTSTGVVAGSTSTAVANGTTAGDLLILRNANAADAITIDGTGGNVECKTDKVLGSQDTITLIWNGSDWVCLAASDN